MSLLQAVRPEFFLRFDFHTFLASKPWKYHVSFPWCSICFDLDTENHTSYQGIVYRNLLTEIYAEYGRFQFSGYYRVCRRYLFTASCYPGAWYPHIICFFIIMMVFSARKARLFSPENITVLSVIASERIRSQNYSIDINLEGRSLNPSRNSRVLSKSLFLRKDFFACDSFSLPRQHILIHLKQAKCCLLVHLLNPPSYLWNSVLCFRELLSSMDGRHPMNIRSSNHGKYN